MAGKYFDKFIVKSNDGKLEYEVSLGGTLVLPDSSYEAAFSVLVSYRGMDAWGREYLAPKLLYAGEILVSENVAHIMPEALRNFLLMEEPGVWAEVVQSIKRAIKR
jgi:hypothetical protein